MAKKNLVEYVCSSCGEVFTKWAGKCPSCNAWSSLEEHKVENAEQKRGLGNSEISGAIPLYKIETEETFRLSSANSEFDRTLGGGFAPGSLILIGGDPGIGKSTLVLQTLALMSAAGVRTLYVSGEESPVQVKLRSERLQVSGSSLMLFCETSLEKILEEASKTKPEILVIDSVQTIYKKELPSTPGSITQLRECTLDLMIFAKNTNCITLLIGHVTKDGQIAGPKILEHMVDTVVYFEGDRNHQYRILRTIKNRFGATDEIGVFEMTSKGLAAVENPSKVFLQEETEGAPGSVVSCLLEGTRAILFEVQALVSQSNYVVPQRVCAGIDPKRITIILALLEKFGGIHVGNSDVFASTTGGMKITETATDLSFALAIASNLLNIPIPKDTIIIGELGLSGEVRGVNLLELRIKEAIRLGFKTLVIPSHGRLPENLKGIEAFRVKKLAEAVQWLMDKK